MQLNDPKLEIIDYHGNTNLFALSILRQRGPLEQQKLLSLACLMPHLADYLALFDTVHHCTLVTTKLPAVAAQFPAKLHLHQGDLFDVGALDVDCIISHAAIHCFNDSRYGNAHAPDKWQRPYQAATKLRQIVGDKTVPAIVSVAVNREEGFFDNNAHLAHYKFIESFRVAGWNLKDYFFDYWCGGIQRIPEYLELNYRRSKTLPQSTDPKEWVVGVYHFA